MKTSSHRVATPMPISVPVSTVSRAGVGSHVASKVSAVLARDRSQQSTFPYTQPAGSQEYKIWECSTGLHEERQHTYSISHRCRTLIPLSVSSAVNHR